MESIRIGNLSTGESRSLNVIGSHAQYVAGFIFYSRGSKLFAARFDPVTQMLKSSPVLVLSDLRSEVYGFSQWSVSENGTFMYAPGVAAPENPLQWVRGDERENLKIPRRSKGTFEISPDGEQLAVLESQASTTDLWLYDFKGTPPRKLTVDGNVALNLMVWMPDGKSIIYHVMAGDLAIAKQLFLDSGMQGTPLFENSDETIRVVSVSQDGRYLTISRGSGSAKEQDAAGRFIDILAVVDTVNDQEIGIPVQNDETWGIAISPNARAVVYTSPESGEYQNYLQPFPPTGQRFQVSRVGGAEEPRWSRDGSKIYYRSGQRIMVVDVQTIPEIKIGEPRVFYAGEFVNVGGRSYDISPDGERALVITASEATATSIRVITNWFDEVDKIISASD
jgi:tricorn protease-like protein